MYSKHMEPTQNNPTKLFLVAAIIILLLGIAYLLLTNRETVKETAVTSYEKPQNTPAVTETSKIEARAQKGGNGLLSLQLKNGSLTASAGESISVLVLAKSTDPVVGFDAVLNFDPKVLSYTTAQNLVPEFQLVPTAKPGQVILTGTKKLSAKEAKVFNNTPVVEVSFKAVKSGQTRIEFEFAPGKTNDSNLMNTKSKDVLGEVSGITVVVK